jgi:hypothetical protein
MKVSNDSGEVPFSNEVVGGLIFIVKSSLSLMENKTKQNKKKKKKKKKKIKKN